MDSCYVTVEVIAMGRHFSKAFNPISKVGSKLGGNQAGATGKGRGKRRGQWIQKAISDQNPGQKRTMKRNQIPLETQPSRAKTLFLLQLILSELGEGDDFSGGIMQLVAKGAVEPAPLLSTGFHILMFVGRRASVG